MSKSNERYSKEDLKAAFYAARSRWSNGDGVRMYETFEEYFEDKKTIEKKAS